MNQIASGNIGLTASMKIALDSNKSNLDSISQKEQVRKLFTEGNNQIQEEPDQLREQSSFARISNNKRTTTKQDSSL